MVEHLGIVEHRLFACGSVIVIAGACARPPAPAPVRPEAPVRAPEQPEPQLEPGPTVLSTDELWLVVSDKGPFYSNLRDSGPRVVSTILPTDDSDGETTRAEVARILEERGRTELEDGELIEISDEQLRALGGARPSTLWMLSDGPPCRAELLRAYVGYYEEMGGTWELGVQIEPCTDRSAPVGISAPEVSESLRWSAAEVTMFEDVSAGGLDDPIYTIALERGLGEPLEDEGVAPVQQVRLLQVPGTELHQLYTIDFWPSDEPCEEFDSIGIDTGLWDGQAPTMEWLEAEDDDDGDFYSSADDAQLQGAVVDGPVPIAIIQKSDYQLVLGVRAREGHYRWSEVITGVYHDEVIAIAGFSVADTCDP